jgi:hypothetical protein
VSQLYWHGGYHVKFPFIVEHVYADVAVVPYDEEIGSSIAHSKI